MKESDIQQQIVQMLSLYAGKTGMVYFAPMNETFMTMMKMFKVPEKISFRLYNWLLKMGLLPGLSDLVILYDGKAFCMEVKTATGTQSEKQKLFMKNVLSTGCDYAVVRSVDQAVECLKIWGII